MPAFTPPPIQFKRSITVGNKPTDSDLLVGEIAINLRDRVIYTKNDSEIIVQLGINSDYDSDILKLFHDYKAADSDIIKRIEASIDSDALVLAVDYDSDLLKTYHDFRAADSDNNSSTDSDIQWLKNRIIDLENEEDSDNAITRGDHDSDLLQTYHDFRAADSDLLSSIDSEFIFSSFNESQKTVYVDPNGSDVGVRSGKSILQPFQTIQRALDSSTDQARSIALMNGVYNENVAITSDHRNTVITGVTGSQSSGSLINVDSITSTGQSGLKLSNFKIVNASTFENTDTSPSATNIGNHYNNMGIGDVTFTGDYFHEIRSSKLANTTMSGAGGKYIYNSQIEGALVSNNSAGATVFIQGSTCAGMSVTGAGSVFVVKDTTALVAGSTISIGAGVIYQINNVTGFNVTIDPAAISIEQFLVSQGTTLDQAENNSTTYFENIKIGLLKQSNVDTGKYLTVDSDNNIRWTEDTSSNVDSDILWLRNRIIDLENEEDSDNTIIRSDHDSDLLQTYHDFKSSDSDLKVKIDSDIVNSWTESEYVASTGDTTFTLPHNAVKITGVYRNGLRLRTLAYSFNGTNQVVYIPANNQNSNLDSDDEIAITYFKS